MTTSTGAEASPAEMAKAALRLLDEGEPRDVLAQLDPTAMRTLLAVAQGASSLEEIELVLQYQQARFKRWHPNTAKVLIDLLRWATRDVRGDDERADRRRAEFAAQQLGLIARAHKVIAAQTG